MIDDATRATDARLVEHWFGDGFARLHPQLQQLHRQGGLLRGPLVTELGTGLGRWLGSILARRMGVPAPSPANRLEVRIHSDAEGLHWDRRFNDVAIFKSLFRPLGHWPDGLWIERSGPLQLGLRVEVIDGAWHWRCTKAWLHGMRIPLGFAPRARAHKEVVGGRYRFRVSLSLPWVGLLLAYGGDLDITPPE
jgi:hypothetical protein